MEYKLREAEESDLDEIQRIEEDSFPDPFSRWNFLYYYLNHPLTFLVAEGKGEILGYLVGVRSFKKITIASIAVKVEYRRRNIATRLIEHLIQKVKGKVRGIELQVRVSNKPAIMFYEKLGFICTKVLPYYYQNGEDALLYYKSLE